MAMAATAATVCVASASSALSARASSRECSTRGSCRVQIAAPSSSASVPSSAKTALSAIGRLTSSSSRSPIREWRWHAVAEQLQAAAAENTAEEAGFPSDALYIFFEAEGSLPEASAAKLTTALESVEGVSNVEIMVSPDGTSTVKLTKQMSVQQTGVASGLVDVLLKGGFKLQAVNLGFDEEGGDDDDLYDYDVTSSTEESEAVE